MYSGGTIDLPAQEKDQIAPGIKKRGRIQQIPKRLAILALVEKELDAFLAFLDCGAQATHGGAVGVTRLQEAAIARDDVVARIASDFDETFGGEHDGVVGFVWVGEDEAVAQTGVPAGGTCGGRVGESTGGGEVHLVADEAGVDVAADEVFDAVLRWSED